MPDDVGSAELSEGEYRRRIRAWTLYDWANSAFATTILAAVLPTYYAGVAGSTLPSPPVATAYWTTTLSISLIVVAVLSPILGTVADVMRGKKKLMSIFVAIGVLGTGLLVLVSTGDWILASLLFIVGRIGWGSANVFYDSLLPHVAKPEDRDLVSAKGYAIGYLGGGLLLVVNVAMIFALDSELGARLSFISVAVWWAVFSIPLFRRVPEPPARSIGLVDGVAATSVVGAGFRQLGVTLREIRHYRELFKYLIAFLIYNDGIGTIIGVAAIYGVELGFATEELILAILLVQFVGIPFSLAFGRIPARGGTGRPFYLAFILFNILALPLVGIVGSRVTATDVVGGTPPAYEAVGQAVGEGTHSAEDGTIALMGSWEAVSSEEVEAATEGLASAARLLAPVGLIVAVVAAVASIILARRRQPTDRLWPLVTVATVAGGALLAAALAQLIVLTAEDPIPYASSEAPNASYEFQFNGETVRITHSTGPDHGSWAVLIDGAVLRDDGEPVIIDAFSSALRYSVRTTLEAAEPGRHTLTVVQWVPDQASTGTVMTVAEIEVLPARRVSSLPTILGLLAVIQVIGLALAALVGRPLFGGMADRMTTKRTIQLAIVAYAIIAAWGFILDSSMEFWFLAWMVAVVQGGSQALSRSLYASMSPTAQSGEFFGFFSVIGKFSAILGPVVFAAAVVIFGSSRPAILSLIVFFVVGIVLLQRVNVDEGRRIAREVDFESLG